MGTTVKKGSGTIHRTIALLETALEQLGANMSPAEVERTAVMIHRGMSRQHRSFHTPEHIFDLAHPDDPHGTLAALFHDLVYYQVDDGFDEEVGALIAPFIRVAPDKSVSLATDVSADSRAFHGCCVVFGFSSGQSLSPFAGLNEFLSALVMGILLEGVVPDQDLLITTACIEATIPFRRPDSDGNSPSQRLRRRLADTVTAMSLDLDEEDLDWAVIRAVAFANRDVRNFAEEDAGRFLDNTWKLLPETNPALRFAGVYTINSYRVAVQKMRGFLCTLDAASIFQRYLTEPHEEEYSRLRDLARRNLIAAGTYLGVKFLTAVILEALAILTGGDAPVALFMGEIRNASHGDTAPRQLVDYLPEQSVEENSASDGVVYRLLDQGRAGDAGFDLQNSPLSLFVYQAIGPGDLDDAIGVAQALCDGTETPEGFLRTLPSRIVRAIAGAAAEMVTTRREPLHAIAARF